jgi:hypothetical protein
MRNILLTSVAAAALSLSGALAVAQDRPHSGAAAEKPSATERAAPGASTAPKSQGAPAAGEHAKQGAAEHASPERGAAAEPRREGQASESKTGESRSHAQQAGESKQQTGEATSRSSESKASTPTGEKNNAASEKGLGAAHSNAATETKGPGAAHSNAATETKGAGTANSNTAHENSSRAANTNAAGETKGTGTAHSNSDAAKSNSAAAPNQSNQPGKAAATRDASTDANSATTTGNARQQPGAGSTGSAGLNQPGSANEGRSNVNAGVNIEPQQQSRIVETLRSRHADAVVNNVNFSVSVDAVVPEHVRFRPLPDEIVSIVPQYRGYSYVIVHDEVVIIEPKTRKIVTVLHKGGSSGASAHRARLSIPTEKRSKIRSEIITSYHGPRDARFDVRIGERLPETIPLQRLPADIYADDPDLRTYEYVVVGEEVVFVEPQTREIVEVLD